jgi:hypothetical protein
VYYTVVQTTAWVTPHATDLRHVHNCRAIGQEVAALPANAVVGFIKVSAKPLKASLATWASKWVYLFTHHLQVSVLAGRSWWYSLLFVDSVMRPLLNRRGCPSLFICCMQR